MPSGLTAAIYENKDVTVEEYMGKVARSMTDFIHMRDESYADGNKLTRRVASDYHEKAIKEAERKLNNWNAFSEDAKRVAYRQHFEDIRKRNREAIDKNLELKSRYQSMKKQVNALDFPPLIEYAKKYALKYLDDSIDFDCNIDYYENALKEADESYESWVKSHEASLQRDIDYHKKQQAEETQRVKDFNLRIDEWSKLVGYEIK